MIRELLDLTRAAGYISSGQSFPSSPSWWPKWSNRDWGQQWNWHRKTPWSTKHKVVSGMFYWPTFRLLRLR
ncbi:hypothetical protein Y032_0133g1748 [Ancylostoma ceylanicum]|uniref:Uncharacterized protein n=1 Tax=Ancylostoma ceylanicum TaxID=53326 RepID=A0A016T6B7_9BILA|nr:hypothetical protein Y032_0133g1748 [Ancylostoma ceylanicum]